MNSVEFFTSYARADDSYKRLKTFVAAVEAKVRGLMSFPEGHKIAFFDVRDIKTGNEWRDILAEPLQLAKVFVCMVSPTYVTRPVCSKEFAVFHERYQTWKNDKLAVWKTNNPNTLNPPSFIIVLEWEKFLFGKPPKEVSDFQTSHDSLPVDYREYGLRDFLLFKKPTAKAYVDLVREVATLIATAINADPGLPPCMTKPEFDSTTNLFLAPETPAARLADVIAAASTTVTPGKVQHAEVEAQARNSGVPFEAPAVLANQPGGML